jgi:lipopolysaccharide export system permease protein
VTRLDRYLAREILSPFFAALAFLFALLFAMQMLRSIDVMFGSAVTAADIARMAAYMAPHFLGMAMPVSFLFAVMLAMGRLTEDREVVALAASGVAPWRLFGAPLALALALAAVGVGLGWETDPRCQRVLRRHVNELIKRNMAGDVKPRVFYDALNSMVLWAQGVDPRTRRFTNVLISDERDPEASMLVLAKSGVVEPQGGSRTLTLALQDGEIHRAAAAGDDYAVVSFDKAALHVEVGNDLLRKNPFSAAKEEMTLPELVATARRARAESKPGDARSYSMAAHKRAAAPLATVAFALCGVPLALGRRRGAKSLGPIATLGAYVGYYVVARMGDAWGEQGRLSPVLAAHVGNLVLLALGLALLARASRRGG